MRRREVARGPTCVPARSRGRARGHRISALDHARQLARLPSRRGGPRAQRLHTLSTDLRDEDGARLPLFFRSFNDYKSPVFPYALAAIFRVTGPSQTVARAFSAMLVLAAVLLLGLLAWRLTRDAAVTAITLLAAGFTPWLFELGRMAIEASTQPLLLALLLLTLERAVRLEHPSVAYGIAAGALLGLFTYSYRAAVCSGRCSPEHSSPSPAVAAGGSSSRHGRRSPSRSCRSPCVRCATPAI